MSESGQNPDRDQNTRIERRHGLVAAACGVFVASMVAAAYAAVPLYSMFCSVTGFGGATRVGASAPDQVLERTMTVRFDANVAPGLPWVFRPEQNEVTVKVGETRMIYYFARNQTDEATHGNASYNVMPGQAGAYFVKMQCFCFNEQTLEGREKMDMPVVFFIDPAIEKDEEMRGVTSVTLSYTFFPAKPSAAPRGPAG